MWAVLVLTAWTLTVVFLHTAIGRSLWCKDPCPSAGLWASATPGGAVLLCIAHLAVLLRCRVQQVRSQFCARQCSTVIDASLAVATAAMHCRCSGVAADASCAAACCVACTPAAMLRLTWLGARCPHHDGVGNINLPAGPLNLQLMLMKCNILAASAHYGRCYSSCSLVSRTAMQLQAIPRCWFVILTTHIR